MSAGNGDRPADLTVAAVIARDAAGRVLVVRKRGTTRFMLPGGKLEPGETSFDAALRELREEVGLALDPARLAPVGSNLTDAANEPGYTLASDVFEYADPVAGAAADAEIAELDWIDPHGVSPAWAPLLIELLPHLRA